MKDAHWSTTPATRRRIDMLAVPTRDRLREAIATARAFREAARVEGRDVSLLVSDEGLRQPRAVDQGPDVEVVGHADKLEWVEALCRRGCDREVVEFALLDPLGLGWTLGANRNFIRLLTHGRGVLVLDDDLSPKLFGPSPVPPSTAPTSGDPTEFWFLRTMDDADALRWPQQDPIAPFEHAWGATAPSGWPPIAASWMGVAGETGSPNALFWLAQEGESRRRLAPDDAAYVAARASGRVMRAVQGLHVVNGHAWTPGAVAYDHGRLLPPFLPVLRGEGLVWGASVAAVGAWSLARVPGALEHRLERPRATDPALARASTAGIAVAGVIQAALATRRMPSTGQRESAGLRHVAARLTELARTPEHLAAWLAELVAARTRRLGDTMHRALERHGRQPATWAADVDALLEDLSRISARPDRCAPYDLADRGYQPAMALLRTIMLRFAALLESWDELVSAAVGQGELRCRPGGRG